MLRILGFFPLSLVLFQGTMTTADIAPEAWKPTLAAAFSGDAIEQCLTGAKDQTECIGQQAATCMNNPGEVPLNHVEGICAEIELEWWDARLNSNYSELMDLLQGFDQSYGNEGREPSATLVGTYRLAQRAWLTFRDASCEHERVSIGSDVGPAGSNAHAHCMMVMTAKRALEMEQTLSYH